MLGLLIGGGKNIHREARDWANRVYLNGGRVSNSTLKAVSDFCMRIDSAGIRDRFIRLNLFCGDDLNSVNIPLYYSTNFQTPRMGNNDKDLIVSFVNSDYVETGSSGGLTTDLSGTKYIKTGLTDTALLNITNNQDTHMSSYITYQYPNSVDTLMGIVDGCSQYSYLSYYTPGSTFPNNEFFMYSDYGSNNYINSNSQSSYGLILGSCYGSNITLYNNITALTTGSTVSWTAQGGAEICVLGYFYDDGGCGGGVFGYYGVGIPIRNTGYSIGKGLSASQVTSYNEIMKQFQTALGRNA